VLRRNRPERGHRPRPKRQWPALRSIAVPVAILLAARCSPAEERSPDPFDPESVPRLSLTEIAEIGRDDGSAGPVLNQVTAAILLSSEEIALASNEGEILVFGSRGDYRRTLGRKGSGPGEFQFIEDIVRLDGDRILAWDPAQDRVTVFRDDGRLEFTCTPSRARSTQAGVVFVGAFGDGRFVLEDRSRRPDLEDVPDGLRSDTIPFLLFDRSGEVVRTLARFARRPRYFEAGSGYQRFLLDSSVQARIAGDELLVGESDALVLQRFDSTGAARAELRLDRDPRPTTEQDVEAAWLAWGEQMVLQQKQMMTQAAMTAGEAISVSRQEAEEAIAGLRKTVQPAGFLPAYRSIVIASDRAVWLEDYPHPTEDVTRWFLMSDDLQPVGWLELPSNERVLAAEPDRLLVLRKDELDVESVVVYGGAWNAEGVGYHSEKRASVRDPSF
jgi:hypothetical protein